MYETFYGFKEKPFSLTPDPRYFYPSRAHREALDHLLYGIREREGFIVITGDVGTGKTTLCRAILQQVEEGTATAVILNPILSEDELLRAILRDFGLSAAGHTKNALVAELNEFLLRGIAAGRRAVLIVDEAQNLSHALLEQIRLLSNLETERDKLIQIILVGQLELLRHLVSPELKQLNQRVSVRYRLRPLSFQEMCQYVYHRLMVAGGTTGVSFSSSALRAIYRYSQGIPRLVNLAADRALLQGYTDQSREISGRRARAGIGSLVDDGTDRRKVTVFARRALLVVFVCMLLTGAAAAWILRIDRARVPFVGRPAAPVASAASPTAPAAAPQFAVLVGAFPTEPAAQEVATRLSNRGLSTVVARSSERGTGGTYSVLIGHFADMAQAQQVRDGLASEEGFAGAQIVQTKNGNASAP